MNIKCGDDILDTLNKPKVGEYFFLNKKQLGKKKIELIDSNNNTINSKSVEIKFTKINENS